MQLATLIMKLSYTDFKIRKLVTKNCKTFIFLRVFFFYQRTKLSFYYILYNLSFLMIVLKEKFFQTTFLLNQSLWILHRTTFVLNQYLQILHRTTLEEWGTGYCTGQIGDIAHDRLETLEEWALDIAQDRSEPLEELDSPSQLDQKLTQNPFF